MIDNGSLVLMYEEAGRTLEVPYQRITALLLGPATSITHDAIRHLAAHGTCIMAVGTEGTRIYTAPPIFERDSTWARQQARLWASDSTRLLVGLRMYEIRFGERPKVSSAEALRGIEAARIKRRYALIAAEHGVPWHGRRYDRSRPEAADLANQAINHAVTAVEALVTVAVQVTGTIPSLGFIHEASAKAWILDICDLYRTAVTVPAACRAAKTAPRSGDRLDRIIRRECAATFRDRQFVDRSIDDIKQVLA